MAQVEEELSIGLSANYQRLNGIAKSPRGELDAPDTMKRLHRLVRVCA